MSHSLQDIVSVHVNRKLLNVNGSSLPRHIHNRNCKNRVLLSWWRHQTAQPSGVISWCVSVRPCPITLCESGSLLMKWFFSLYQHAGHICTASYSTDTSASPPRGWRQHCTPLQSGRVGMEERGEGGEKGWREVKRERASVAGSQGGYSWGPIMQTCLVVMSYYFNIKVVPCCI